MWIEIGAILAAFVVGYVVYVLCWNTATPGLGGPIDDFIIPAEDADNVALKNHNSVPSKYNTCYEDPGKQILILYGSEYGFSEELARKLFDRFTEEEDGASLGLQPRVLNSKHYKLVDYTREQVILHIFSTTGDGVPPSDCRAFMEFITSGNGTTPSLAHVKFSVLALGDSNYPHFCKTGRTLDARLHELHAQELYTRVDVDEEDWEAINKWMDGVVAVVMNMDLQTTTDYLDLTELKEEEGFSRTRPFWAKISDKYPLTSLDVKDDKETIHIEVDVSGSDLAYTAGDAIGIIPVNNPPEVDLLLAALHCTGKEKVPIPNSAYEPKPKTPKILLKEALLKYYDLKMVKMDMVKLLGESVTRRKEVDLGKKLLSEGVSLHDVLM
jgi:sulfite reductase (NADPH) flavoprotein alpha-component